MRELCDEWNIDYKKIRAVITDGGQNIKAAVREEFGADKHISCVAHLLNQVGQAAIGLAVSKAPSELEAHEVVVVPENEKDAEFVLEDVPDDDALNDDGTPLVELRPLLMKVKRIVRFFRTSNVASRMLVEMQLQDGKQEHDALKLIQEVRTRWNACYYMLERFLNLTEPVSQVLLQLPRESGATRRKPPNLLSGDQLDVLREVKDLLKPLEEATLMVSKGRSVTLSDVIPVVYGLKQGIHTFQPSHPITFNLQQKLLSEVNTRFSDIEYRRPYAAATILDPRYKKYVFEHPHAVALIVRHLSGKVAEKVGAAGRALEKDLAGPNTAPPPYGIWAAVDQALRRSCTGTMGQESESQMPSQFKAYCNSPVVDRCANPSSLETWYSMRVGLEHVFEVAMEFLSIPATSVASERLFSHAGWVASQRRCRLSPELFSQLTFLRSVEKSMWFKNING
ncbi:zinc finger BED domain-containing protein 4-like [Dermacentor andersoni]|uniref:zinc finger BED domain-containing protein 4-like n=1 Tax=Dermacentor andersoni TaxID=34620 RepID=UPI002416E0AF|nr:zinc finger BED domain-containing protein 4-like [Dermacentor andersoni]